MCLALFRHVRSSLAQTSASPTLGELVTDPNTD